jgi:citrate synthase
LLDHPARTVVQSLETEAEAELRKEDARCRPRHSPSSITATGSPTKFPFAREPFGPWISARSVPDRRTSGSSPYDPRLHEHRLDDQPHHRDRRRPGHPALSGYPIEELAERSHYLETAYLLIHGELPTVDELDAWVYEITHHTWIHENVKKFMDGFHHDAHPMGMLVSTVAALSTFYPEAKDGADPATRRRQMVRLIAKMPTLAAFAYRHSLGMPYAYPDNALSYTGNFLNMLFKTTEVRYEPNPVLERALEVLFILHADHEQNCSTNAVRSVGSSQVDPYSAVAGGVAALYGPLHGGANEAVLRMLGEIATTARIPEFIRDVKGGKAKLMGFGHRVYKNYDPRATIIKRMADEVFGVTRPSPLLPVALELERIALQDEYFVTRKLYPNVDFYSGSSTRPWDFPWRCSRCSSPSRG